MPNKSYAFLATALASRREKLVALWISGATLLAFIALVPFVRQPLPPWPAFIPAYELALFLIDLVTATVLIDQFERLRSVGILVLACGYLFDALMIIPHALSFPGAFTATGLLGAKEQTTVWLYVFWHGGFPLFMIGYAILRRLEDNSSRGRSPPTGWLILGACIFVGLLAIALTLLATWGHDLLPIVMQGSNYSMLVSKGISPTIWTITLVAFLALWRPKQQQRVLDLWLMVVMWVWLFDIALAAVIGSERFDLGFYAGRIFGLIAASFLLVTLLVEMARLHAAAIGRVASAEAQLAQMSGLREQPKRAANTAASRGESTASFIHRQNIAHYRTLLESGTLDDARRTAIERLLAEEEAKSVRPDGPQKNRKNES